MSDWYTAVSQDISKLPDCIEYYESEILEARKDIALAGSIEKASAKLPSVVELRFNQLQEIEGILEPGISTRTRTSSDEIGYRSIGEGFARTT